MEMSTIKSLATTAVVLGGVCLLYINRKRLAKLFTSHTVDRKPVKQNDDVMVEVCKAFIMYADIFQGLYEPLHKASIGCISQERIKNILTEWNIRMTSIQHIPIGLRGWWTTVIANKDALSYNELQIRSQKVIQMIENCGIIRDKQSELVAESDTNQYYQNVDGIKIEVGQNLHIESPCWYMQSEPVRIIEKGYCEIL